MSIKKVLKNNKTVRRAIGNYKTRREFRRDYKSFRSYNNGASRGVQDSNIQYQIMLLVHSLEKGMCYRNLRPFGGSKIKQLQILLKQINNNSTAAKMGYSIIKEWLELYEENGFNKDSHYLEAKKFLKESSFVFVDVGAIKYSGKRMNFDLIEFLKSRHSVREFSKKALEEDDVMYAIKASQLSPTACNRQMVKIHKIISSQKKALLDNKIIGLSGFEKNNITYFVVTYDISAFVYYGERSQGLFNAGLVSMNFVNALHNRGIGSCFLQWGNSGKEEEAVKKAIGIGKSEKIATIIAAGYYNDETKVPKSFRKNISEIYDEL